MTDKLNDKQRRFVEEYLVDLNATQAATRAGYSAKTANEQGARLLANASVKAAIAEGIAARSERVTVTQDQVVEELAKLAFANIADVTDWGMKEVAFGYDEDGKRLRAEDIADAVKVEYIPAPFVEPINRDAIRPEVLPAVAEVSLGREGFKIKMHDKGAALGLLARHLGMLKDKVEHSGSLTLEQVVAQSIGDKS